MHPDVRGHSGRSGAQQWAELKAALAAIEVKGNVPRRVEKASKEAAVKALGTGFSQGVGLHDIAVAHEAAGRPFLVYSGEAGRLREALGIRESHLSIADEREYAVAFVTLVRG